MLTREQRQFVRALLKRPAEIGAVAPSSRALARAMVEPLDLQPGRSVLEFGPGTGPFTDAIRKRRPEDSPYLGIEAHGPFVEHLARRFPDLRFVEGSAEGAARLHRELDYPPVAAIVCGLPFASLPADTQDGVLRSLDELLPAGGQFCTFQYVHSYPLPAAIRFRRRMAELFGPPESQSLVVANLPPARVLRWVRNGVSS